MRKIVLLLALLAIGTIAFSQEITVRFTGQLNGTDYCRLDSVKVTNITRDWTETVEYPDTIIVLGGTVGTDLNIAATQGLGQNIPNPFDCETRVELSVSQRENVRMQLLDASGKQYAEYNGSLDAGVHTFDISAAAPQTYVLNATVGSRSYSIRMVNMGSGCGSSIKYAGVSGSITAKLTTANEFQTGDNMRYIGYMTIYGDIVASTVVEQVQTASEDITLNFAHCINTFGIDIQTACDSYTWIDDVTYTESTNEPTFTLINAAGCDSVVTLHLTINHSNTGIDEQSACESYTWINGVTYTESTTEPTFTLTNAVGCDSIVTLHLSINHNIGIDTQVACDSYTWIDGVTYTESTNEPTFTLTNVAGCDSVVTLNLTIACLPTVQTNAASSISTTGATLNGNVTADGGATVTARGFVYGTSASNLSQNEQSGTGTGNFMKALTGLSHSTTYYYKAYATNSVGTSYGEVMTFTTIAVSLPTITTGSASSITSASAILSGNVTSDGNATVTARGFVYGTSANNLSQTVQSGGNGTGSFTRTLTGLTASTTYYYKAYATNSAGTAYGEIKQFTTTEATTGALNGHDWVDLGLPSGTRWATCNVGASTPTEIGGSYAWGETTTKGTYNNSTYSGISIYTTTLPANRDAATANWGAGWRMPTYDEMNELKNNCTVTWTTRNGSNGCLFTGPNGNSIFLVAGGLISGNAPSGIGSSGKYWSSSRTGVAGRAWELSFYSGGCYILDDYNNYNGLKVRAVCSPQN